jgi:CCR4-NOT transcriptional regulation complex NOT5 subunit
LLPLMRVPHVKAHRARILYDVGIKTVEQLASSSVEAIALALAKYQPFHLSTAANNNGRKDRNNKSIKAASSMVPHGTVPVSAKRESIPLPPAIAAASTTSTTSITVTDTKQQHDGDTKVVVSDASIAETTTVATATATSAAEAAAAGAHAAAIAAAEVVEAKRRTRHNEQLREASTIIRAARYLHTQQLQRRQRAISRIATNNMNVNNGKNEEWDPNVDEIVGSIHMASSSSTNTSSTLLSSPSISTGKMVGNTPAESPGLGLLP